MRKQASGKSCKDWKHAAVAAALAYVLVLQALLLSLGGGLHAAELHGPQAVICSQEGAARPDPSPVQAHDGLCCILSCHGSSPVGPVPLAGSFERLAPVAAALPIEGEAPVLVSASKLLPVGSRAPPRLG